MPHNFWLLLFCFWWHYCLHFGMRHALHFYIYLSISIQQCATLLRSFIYATWLQQLPVCCVVGVGAWLAILRQQQWGVQSISLISLIKWSEQQRQAIKVQHGGNAMQQWWMIDLIDGYRKRKLYSEHEHDRIQTHIYTYVYMLYVDNIQCVSCWCCHMLAIFFISISLSLTLFRRLMTSKLHINTLHILHYLPYYIIFNFMFSSKMLYFHSHDTKKFNFVRRNLWY